MGIPAPTIATPPPLLTLCFSLPPSARGWRGQPPGGTRRAEHPLSLLPLDGTGGDGRTLLVSSHPTRSPVAPPVLSPPTGRTLPCCHRAALWLAAARAHVAVPPASAALPLVHGRGVWGGGSAAAHRPLRLPTRRARSAMAVVTPTTVALALALAAAVAVTAAPVRRLAAWLAWRRRLRLPPAATPRGGAPPLVGVSHLRLALSEAESAAVLAGAAGAAGLVTTAFGPVPVVSALSAAAAARVLALDFTGTTSWWFPPPWRGAFGAASLFATPEPDHAADHATAGRCLSGAAADALVPSLELRVEVLLNEWCAAGVACSAYPKCKMAALLLLTEGLFGRVVDQRTCAKMARLYDDVNGRGAARARRVVRCGVRSGQSLGAALALVSLWAQLDSSQLAACGRQLT